MPDRTLVAYDSMGGNPRRIANEIRAITGAEPEEIREPTPGICTESAATC